MNRLVIPCLAMFLVLSSGCPSLEFIQVPVTTKPSGATVTVNGVIYTTPTVLVVPRDIEVQPLVFTHRDFPDRVIPWKKLEAGQSLLGILFLPIDVLRLGGRGWAMEPEEIHLNLRTGCYLDRPEDWFGAEPICPQKIKTEALH